MTKHRDPMQERYDAQNEERENEERLGGTIALWIGLLVIALIIMAPIVSPDGPMTAMGLEAAVVISGVVTWIIRGVQR